VCAAESAQRNAQCLRLAQPGGAAPHNKVVSTGVSTMLTQLRIKSTRHTSAFPGARYGRLPHR
jgi:hypothetical protein